MFIALTVIGCVVIVQAASVVQQRAQLQESADSIALAALTYNESSLQALAQKWNVYITDMYRHDDKVHVTVQSSLGEATSTATLAYS